MLVSEVEVDEVVVEVVVDGEDNVDDEQIIGLEET